MKRCFIPEEVVHVAGATSTDETQVVLTEEGRRRLTERLDAATEELEELDRQLQDRDQRDQLLAARARVVARIASLRETLQRAVDVGEVDEDPTIVELGDEVELEDEDGDREQLVLVHPAEVDAQHGHISVASPLAQALLGRRVGEQVSVQAPAGSYQVTIVQRRRAV